MSSAFNGFVRCTNSAVQRTAEVGGWSGQSPFVHKFTIEYRIFVARRQKPVTDCP